MHAASAPLSPPPIDRACYFGFLLFCCAQREFNEFYGASKNKYGLVTQSINACAIDVFIAIRLLALEYRSHLHQRKKLDEKQSQLPHPPVCLPFRHIHMHHHNYQHLHLHPH